VKDLIIFMVVQFAGTYFYLIGNLTNKVKENLRLN